MKGYFINFNQRARFIVTIFICAFTFFCTPQLTAQDVPVILDEQQTSDLSNQNLTLTQQQVDDLKAYQPKVDAVPIKTLITNVVTIRFESHAKVAVILKEPAKENLLVLRDVKNGEILRGHLQDLDIIFTKVRTDRDYDLLEQQEGQKEVKVIAVSAAAKPSGVAVLSDNFYLQLSAYSMDPKEQSLRNFLMDVKACSYWEKLSFYQLHALKGQSLSDNLQEGEFPYLDESSTFSPNVLGGTCACTFITKATREFSPGRPWNNSFLVSGDNIFSDYSPNWIAESSTLRAYSHSAAAKWQEIESKGEFSSNGMTWQHGTDKDGNGASFQYANLSYALFCTNYLNQVPSDCECSKPLYLTAQYKTKLNTSSSTAGCFWCWGDRGAVAAAEDWSMLLEHNVKTGSVVPLGAGNAVSKSQCGSTINTDFFVNLLDFTALIVKKIAVSSINVPNPGGNAVVSTLSSILANVQGTQFVSDVKTSLQALLQTPVVSSTGCGADQKEALLVNYSGYRYLVPNRPMVYTIASSSNLTASGFTRWQSRAKILSDFFLGAVLQGSTSDDCCNSSVANWVSSSYGSTSVRPLLETRIYSAWLESNSPSIAYDFGYKEGIRTPACSELKARGGQTNSDVSLRQAPDGIYMSGRGDETYDCIVTDILGRVSSRYKGTAQDTKILNFNVNNSEVSGVYFIQVLAKSGFSKTFKIIKN